MYDKLNKTEESGPARLANYQQAVHAFTKWIELQPTNSDAYIERMDIYRNLYAARAIGSKPSSWLWQTVVGLSSSIRKTLALI